MNKGRIVLNSYFGKPFEELSYAQKVAFTMGCAFLDHSTKCDDPVMAFAILIAGPEQALEYFNNFKEAKKKCGGFDRYLEKGDLEFDYLGFDKKAGDSDMEVYAYLAAIGDPISQIKHIFNPCPEESKLTEKEKQEFVFKKVLIVCCFYLEIVTKIPQSVPFFVKKFLSGFTLERTLQQYKEFRKNKTLRDLLIFKGIDEEKQALLSFLDVKEALAVTIDEFIGFNYKEEFLRFPDIVDRCMEELGEDDD